MHQKCLVPLVLLAVVLAAPSSAQERRRNVGEQAPNGLVSTEEAIYIFKEHDFLFRTEDRSATYIDGIYTVSTPLENAAGESDVYAYCDFRVGQAQTSYPQCPTGDVHFTGKVGTQELFQATDSFRPGVDAPGCDPLVGVAVAVDLSAFRGRGQKFECVIDVEDDQYPLAGSQWVWAIPSLEYEYEVR